MISRYRLASWALEDMAERLGIPLNKALDPLKPKDFLTIVARLASSLKSATKGAEAEALRAAIDSLDVDWPSMSEAQKFRVFIAAKAELQKLKQVPAAAEDIFAGSSIVSATRVASVKKFGLEILTEPTTATTKLAELLRSSQMVYIKDEYGRRVDALDDLARSTVASGLEQGLGRADISADLAKTLAEYDLRRSQNYWNLIANDFANKSRTASQVYAMDEAGVTVYEFSAVGDEVTCAACGFLDGKQWSVPHVKTQIDYALELSDPEDIKNVRPFLRAGRINGENVAYYEKHGERFIAAQKTSDGFRQLISDEALFAAGVTLPPIHGACRCTIISD